MEVASLEQVGSCSSSDVTEHKRSVTAKSSGVVGRILELKKRRQQLNGMLSWLCYSVAASLGNLGEVGGYR